MNTLYEQSSPGVPNIQQLNTESNDNFLATLAEDNANSLPSVCDEKIAHSSIDVRVRTNRDVDAIEESASDSSSLQAISDDIPNGNMPIRGRIADRMQANIYCAYTVSIV